VTGRNAVSYQRLTEAETQTFVEEFTAFQRWRAYASYATDLYGAAAERVEVATGTERNDEFSYLVIGSVEVYDALGQLLEPDLSTDWWQTALQSDTSDERAGYYLDDEDAREDWLADAIGERRAALPLPTGGYDIFLVSRPPKRTHRNIYAPG
jgi:hypothetical protein